MKMRLLIVSVLLAFGFPVIMNEVVDSFDKCSDFFLDGQPPTISGILEKSVSQDNNRYKLICQKYRNAYRFATLYDTNKKIPVFSAYRYTGKRHNEKRPQIPWMIEPQLESFGSEMRVPTDHQADNADYLNNVWKLDRGHLLPSSYAVDELTSESTFTLTNVVPQHKKFNTGSWNKMENEVKNIMDSHCHVENPNQTFVAFVLIGAVASENNLLKNKVNIPTHMWSVFCCYNQNINKWVSQAHWAENTEHSTEATNPRTLQELQVFLDGKYGQGAKLFKDKCLNFLNVPKINLDMNTEGKRMLRRFILPAQKWKKLKLQY